MIETIALILFLAVLAAMMAAPGTPRRPRTAPVPSPKPVDTSVGQTA